MQISQYNHKYIIQHYTTYTWIWIIWRKPYAKTLNTWRSTNGKFCVNESVISFGWFTVFSFGDQLITKCQAGRVKLASHWDLLFCCTLTSSTYNTAMNHKTEAFSLQLQKRMNAQAIMVFHFVEKQNKAQWMFLQEAARAPPWRWARVRRTYLYHFGQVRCWICFAWLIDWVLLSYQPPD